MPPKHLLPPSSLNLPLKFYKRAEWLYHWMSYRCWSPDGTTFCLNTLWRPAALCCYLHQCILSRGLILLGAVQNIRLLSIPSSQISCVVIPWMFYGWCLSPCCIMGMLRVFWCCVRWGEIFRWRDQTYNHSQYI